MAASIGPELPAPDQRVCDHLRKSNPEPVYRDHTPTGDVQAASSRADAVSQRFGGGRHSLSRPTRRTDDSESDPHD